jgi:NAD(P) transhydrogenase subunit alpha
MSLPILLALFIVASVIGYKVISDVPSLLHTPLMSGSNALSGVTVLGALTVAAVAKAPGHKFLGAIAIVLAMINVVGGFLVTHKMLRMFKKGTESEGRKNVIG